MKGRCVSLKMRKLMAMLLAAVMLLCACAAAEENAQGIDLSGHIVILHTNDSHGRVDTNLGFSRVAVAKERLEGAGATVLLLDAGDTLHGLPFATVSEGESVVKLMNAVGYDAMTAGNHDYNYGKDRLAELNEMASFPILAANVLKEDGTTLLDGAAVIEKGNVKFGEIPRAVRYALDHAQFYQPRSIDEVYALDGQARNLARKAMTL